MIIVLQSRFRKIHIEFHKNKAVPNLCAKKMHICKYLQLMMRVLRKPMVEVELNNEDAP